MDSPLEVLQQIRRRSEDLNRRRALQEAAAAQAVERMQQGKAELHERFGVDSVKAARERVAALESEIEAGVAALAEKLQGAP